MNRSGIYKIQFRSPDRTAIYFCRHFRTDFTDYNNLNTWILFRKHIKASTITFNVFLAAYRFLYYVLLHISTTSYNSSVLLLVSLCLVALLFGLLGGTFTNSLLIVVCLHVEVLSQWQEWTFQSTCLYWNLGVLQARIDGLVIKVNPTWQAEMRICW